MIRRLIDIVAALAALILFSPLLVLIPIAIMIESPGNPFFRGSRAGKHGKSFGLWKFRTMVPDADRIGPSITGGTDPRILRTGAFLRRSKLDELPQIINLLTGEMTLVGPRPEATAIVARYSPEQREVLEVKPGLTGPGQVALDQEESEIIPEGVDADDYYVEHLMGPKLERDLAYLRTRTARSDLRIVMTTGLLVVRRILGIR